MKKLRVVLCDDYDEDLNYYESLMLKLAEQHKIDIEVKTYVNGDDIMFDVEDPDFLKVVDLMILDISMPGPDGIEVAEAARENGYLGLIVFLTVSRTHYEPAFDVKGFNYITKNANAPKRFEKVFMKAVMELRDGNKEAIVLTGGGNYRQIRISSIRYFEVQKNLITVHYGKNETFEFISTLTKLENQLESHGFYRAQRSYLVNLNQVAKITFEMLSLQDGTEIPVGRKYYKGLKEILHALSKAS